VADTWQPSGLNPFDMIHEERAERLHEWRIHRRAPVAILLDEPNRFPADETLLEEAIAELADIRKHAKQKPADGELWYDTDQHCSICGDEGDLVQDHCHTTGLFRGYLCRSCNLAEGIRDSATLKAWRTSAPYLKIGRRWLYRQECDDCTMEDLEDIAFPIWLDYHSWWKDEMVGHLMVNEPLAKMLARTMREKN
jgi:hypothetical protein